MVLSQGNAWAWRSAALLFVSGTLQAAELPDAALKSAVDGIVQPLMSEQGIKGMAVGVTLRGVSHLYSYGVASAADRTPVTEHTLFEIGSLSKTFTATLAAYAQANKQLALSDSASRYLPELLGSAFDRVTLLDLATYTAGGLPLQFPEWVDNEQKMFDYYRQWHPAYKPTSHRQYSNPSIGLLGYITARKLGRPFDELLEAQLFPALGLHNSFVQVPTSQMPLYAQGYTASDKPVRVSKGVLDAQAYGVKTTAADMLRFIELNISSATLSEPMQRAITATQQPHYAVGDMNQGLGWELYRYPITLAKLVAGNSAAMALEAQAIKASGLHDQPDAEVLINKTGSTNGFGAYALFIPAKRIGVVLLANKNYPNAKRVEAALQIISTLDDQTIPAP